jgi:hypothetical protein
MKKIMVLVIALALTACGFLTKMDRDRRTNYVASHPELTEKVRDCIFQGKIMFGMTKEEVIASWGEPARKNMSAGKWGIHDQWVYNRVDRYGIPYTDPMWYLYFENGKITSMQGPGK